VFFTNEAIEALRRCHGEFIALVASDLVSRKDEEYEKSHEKGPKKSPVMTPKEAKITMTSLNFDDLVTSESILYKASGSPNDRESDGDVNDRHPACGETTQTKRAAASINRTKVTKGKRLNTGSSQRKKFKSAFKNIKVTAELLKEQERLFASSAAKVKMDSNI